MHLALGETTQPGRHERHWTESGLSHFDITLFWLRSCLAGWRSLRFQSCELFLAAGVQTSIIRHKMPPNQPDRANRRQPLGFREPVGEAGVSGMTAAVAHPGR